MSGPDADAVLRRRDEVVHDLDDSSQLPWLEERGIELVRGRGRLTGERRVEVDGRTLEARRAVVLAGGSLAAIPPIDGLADIDPWTNRLGTTSKEVPESLVVLGGGVAGVELAQAWRSLGSEVVVLEAGDCVLSREEPFAGELVAAQLVEDGVDLRINAKAERVAREDGRVVVSLEGGDTAEGDGDAGGGRPQAADRGPRARDGRAAGPGSTSRPTPRSRCRTCRGCTPSATRTAAPPHAHGQVPGPPRRRQHRRR